MDVVLVNPSPCGQGLNESTIEPCLGLAYMAAVLEQNGFSCMIIDAQALFYSTDEVVARIPEDTKLVGFYMNSYLFNSVKEMATAVREKRKNALIIIGGPLASAAPEMVLREIPNDAVIRGEGEFALLKMMQNIRENRFVFDGEVSGLSYMKTDKDIHFCPVERITDLDKLPFPAYHLLPSLQAYKTRARKKPMAAMITSRGCSYGCSFCSKDIFQRRVTFRGVKNVLDEIDLLVEKYGMRQLDILDDNLAQKRDRLVGVLNGIIERKHNLAINLQSGVRSELLDEEILFLMKKAGVFKLAFGIEAADEEVLRINRKRLDLKKVERIAKTAKKMGFLVYGFFIVGLIGETEEAFNKTLEFARKVDFDVANFCMAVPFVGTELYRMVQENGRFLIDTTRNIESGFYDSRVFYTYDKYTEQDILRRYKRAYKEFYSLKKQLKTLLKIRSADELRWILGAGSNVIGGMLRQRLARNTDAGK